MKYVIILFLLTAFTCQSKKEKLSESELSILLNNSLIKYHEFQNIKYLEDAYHKINNNPKYLNANLTASNSQLVIALLMNLKKYEELEIFLEKTTSLDEYNKLKAINITKFLKLKRLNKAEADMYIEENIIKITDSLRNKKADSLIYFDYFSMRMFLVGKEETIYEIDSMQTSNQKYSNKFYELLKESIKIFPDDHL